MSFVDLGLPQEPVYAPQPWSIQDFWFKYRKPLFYSVGSLAIICALIAIVTPVILILKPKWDHVLWLSQPSEKSRNIYSSSSTTKIPIRVPTGKLVSVIH